MECRQAANFKKCPCTYDCELKGKCCETKKTYDRSFKKFIEENLS